MVLNVLIYGTDIFTKEFSLLSFGSTILFPASAILILRYYFNTQTFKAKAARNARS